MPHGGFVRVRVNDEPSDRRPRAPDDSPPGGTTLEPDPGPVDGGNGNPPCDAGGWQRKSLAGCASSSMTATQCARRRGRDGEIE